MLSSVLKLWSGQDDTETPETNDLWPEEVDYWSTALLHLHMALDTLPEERKIAYNRAMKVCPHLVETESDPVRFLRFTRCDPWAAAERLCNYWEMRQRIFGEDRYCRPLTLTGAGAFEPDDIEYLQYGTCAVLPEDCYGRPVVYTDRNRVPAEYWEDERCEKWTCRATFWLHHIVSMHPAAQEPNKGWVLLFQHVEGRSRFQKRFQALVNEFYNAAFPLRRFEVLHGFVFSTRRHYFLEKLLPEIIPKLLSIFRKNFYAHVLRSPDQCYGQLEPYGFAKCGVPQDLGGTWSFEENYDSVFETLRRPGSFLEFGEGGVLQARVPFPDEAQKIAPKYQEDRNNTVSLNSTTLPDQREGGGSRTKIRCKKRTKSFSPDQTKRQARKDHKL